MVLSDPLPRHDRREPPVIVSRLAPGRQRARARALAAPARDPGVGCAGYVDAELQPPNDLHPDEWVVIHRFADPAALATRMRSPARQPLLASGADFIDGDAREQVVALTPDSARVTAVSSLRRCRRVLSRLGCSGGNQASTESTFPSRSPGTPIPHVMDRPLVMTLFTRQHSVASIGQLRPLGVTKTTLSRACAAGTLERLHRGVYRLGGSPRTFEGDALALQLFAGRSAFLSGPTAGVLHQLRDMPRSPMEVTVHEARRVDLPAPHRLVRTSWLVEERDIVTRRDGIHLATPLRMLFGLACRFDEHRFERAAEDVWHRGLVTPEQAHAYLTAIRRSGRTGVARMEHWLDKTSFREKPAQSGLQVAFVEMIERVGLPTPVRQHPLTLLSGETIHLDLAWPTVRLAVEPGHSWWHGGDLRQRADQARDRACALLGWHVHRYDEAATRNRAATARELLALYHRRAADIAGVGSPETRLR